MVAAFLFLLVISLGHVSCAEIYFNTTAVCESTCNWNDSTLWIGGVVPSLETDYVVINNTGNLTILLVYNSIHPIHLGRLSLSEVTLSVENASLSADEWKLENSFLLIDYSSSVVSLIVTEVLSSSAILLDGGRFEQSAFGEQFVLDETSAVVCNGQSVLILKPMALLSGSLDLFDGSTLVGETVFFYRDIILPNHPSIESGALVGITASFPNGLEVGTLALFSGAQVTIFQSLGEVDIVTIEYDSFLYLRNIASSSRAYIKSFSPNTGTLFISSSNITLGNGHNVLVPNLILAGAIGLSLTAIEIRSVTFTTGENGENAYISMNISLDPVTFSLNSVLIPGEILLDNSFLVLSGNFSLSGGIQSLAGVIVVDGRFSAFGPIVLVTEATFVPSIHFQGFAVLSTPLLHLQEVTMLENDDNTTIIGNVRNEGIVNIIGIDTLTIIGNYTQAATGQLIFAGLEPINNISGLLNVTGQAHIDGTLSYGVINATEAPTEIRFLVLWSSQKIQGKFNQDPIDNGGSNATVRLDYSDQAIYFVYGIKSTPDDDEPKFWGLEWWTWLLIACGGLLLVVLAPLIYYKSTRKSKYEPIEE